MHHARDMNLKNQTTLVQYRKMTPEERNKDIPKHVFNSIRMMQNHGMNQADHQYIMTTDVNDYTSAAIPGFSSATPANGAIISASSSAQQLIQEAIMQPNAEQKTETPKIAKPSEEIIQFKKSSEIANQAGAVEEKPAKLGKVEEVIGQAAASIARSVNANCVVSIEKKEHGDENPTYIDVKVVVFKRLKTTFHKVEYHTKMRRLVSGSVIPIKELLMEAINKKYIGKDDRVVCVSDESVGSGYKGLLFIFDVDKVFFNMSVHHLADSINPEVLESVINLALEIGSEGREGKSIGTAFIIGNTAELSPHTRQLIINPFTSVPENQRMITDANLRETIKGFAQLDGVFTLTPEGLVVSAGTHLNADMNQVDLSHLQGFGTRHRYCAAITKITKAVAIVVSESGGTVRIFKDGEIIMKLP